MLTAYTTQPHTLFQLPELAKELGRVCKASVSRSRDVVEAAVQSLLDQFHQQVP